jgi:hypothetical protein
MGTRKNSARRFGSAAEKMAHQRSVIIEIHKSRRGTRILLNQFRGTAGLAMNHTHRLINEGRIAEALPLMRWDKLAQVIAPF